MQRYASNGATEQRRDGSQSGGDASNVARSNGKRSNGVSEQRYGHTQHHMHAQQHTNVQYHAHEQQRFSLAAPLRFGCGCGSDAVRLRLGSANPFPTLRLRSCTDLPLAFRDPGRFEADTFDFPRDGDYDGDCDGYDDGDDDNDDCDCDGNCDCDCAGAAHLLECQRPARTPETAN